MHKYGLLAKIRRKRFVHCDGETRTYANLLNRNFYADRPNQKWVTGISYIPTKQGTLYLSVIRDLFDLSIVAYKTSTRQSIKLVLDTIRTAIEKEEVTAELLLHSDQGFQYASQSYFALTTQYGITPSMSRRANPYAFVFTSQRSSMKHRHSLMVISLFATMNACSLTPSSLFYRKTTLLCVILRYPTYGGFISLFSFWYSSFAGGLDCIGGYVQAQKNCYIRAYWKYRFSRPSNALPCRASSLHIS